MGRDAASRRWGRWAAAVVFVGLAAYGFLRSGVYRAPAMVDVAGLRLHTLEGMPLDAQAVKGRVVVLNFWAPWCPPCQEEMPLLDTLQREHPGVVVIGLEDDVEAAVEARGMERWVAYPLVLRNEEVRRRLGQVPVLPTTLYLSASGHVVHTVQGAVPVAVMRGYLADAVRAK